MSIRPQPYPSGTVSATRHASQVLRDNPWQDPATRMLKYWTPADKSPEDVLPAIWYLTAYTNSGAAQDNWQGFRENLPQRLDRLYAQGALPAVRVFFPDGFMSLGGNQYVDSVGLGRYETWLHQELIPFTEKHCAALPGAAHRAVVGKSSGGYAALRFGIQRTADWAAIGSHAGDCGFEQVFIPDFAIVSQTLAEYDYDAGAFLQQFWHRNKPRGSDIHTLMMCGLALSYDPDSRHPERVQWPMDLRTLKLDEERWQHWRLADPLQMDIDPLRRLRKVFIDVGNRDQYRIQYGTRALVDCLSAAEIAHDFEEFEGTHSGIDYRLDVSLPLLAQAIQP